MHDTNVVTNFKSMKEVIVKVSDFYHEVMKQEAAQLAEKYVEVGNRLETFTAKLLAYDRSWNEPLWKQAESLQRDCEKYTKINIDIPKMDITDRKTGYALHDFVYQITLVENWFTKIDLWETQIRTSAPTPPPTPGSGSTTEPQPQPKPEPKVVNMKSKMPKGKKHVSDYKSWLMQQLAIVNQMKGDDIVDFDN
jgi:DNA-binding transcriptional regulator GbsR (MarR family)